MSVQADFEDSLAPVWTNTIEGHINLRDAISGVIRYEDPARHKVYTLNEKTAVLFVRPRGWHLQGKCGTCPTPLHLPCAFNVINLLIQ